MRIETLVTLGEGDALEYTPEECANAILLELGGDPASDYSVVTVQMPPTIGSAGTPPPPPEMLTP